MNIYQKMANVTAELQTVAKNLDVDTGKGKSYKAVSERDIIDAVKPLEVKHGIYSYPCSREILESQTLESETQYGVKTTFFSRIKTTYRFVNVDDPQDYIDTVTFAEGIDSQDKGSGKAMTYADKYALMKAYKISTGDDPDQDPSKEERYKRAKTEKHVIPSAGDMVPTCADCGAEISEKVHDWSVKKFGKPLCYNCQKKAQAAQRDLENYAANYMHEDAGDRV